MYIYYIFHRVYEPCSRCILCKMYVTTRICVVMMVMIFDFYFWHCDGIVIIGKCRWDKEIFIWRKDFVSFFSFLSFWLREFGTKCVTNHESCATVFSGKMFLSSYSTEVVVSEESQMLYSWILLFRERLVTSHPGNSFEIAVEVWWFGFGEKYFSEWFYRER